MLRTLSVIAVSAALCFPAAAAERRHGVLVGAILKLDAAAKTVVVKAADGTEHTLRFVRTTAVHGTEDAAVGAKGAFLGLKEGSEVAVHYTAKGSVETADEIDKIGRGGLKTTEATVTHVDRGAKTLTVKTADGAEETFRMTDRVARDAGKDTARGAEKSGKATIYYTEKAGRKVAHVLKRAI